MYGASRAIALAFVTLLLPAVCRASELAAFVAGDSGWHLGTLGVGNIDDDATLEIVVPHRDSTGRWFLDAFKPDGRRVQGFPYVGDGPINASPTLSDLNGDGRDEILFTCGNRVIALRGNGSTLWSSEVNRFNYRPHSGFMTSPDGFYWSEYGNWIPGLPEGAVFSSEVSSPIVADLDGNGRREVVTGWKIDPDRGSDWQDFNPFINDIWGSGEWGTMGETWSGGVICMDAATGGQTYTYHLHQLVESGVALGQADADKPLEVYVLNDSDSVVCFDKTQPHGTFGSGTLHGQFGKNVRLMSGSYQQPVDVHTVDLDGDGRAEVLVPTTQLNPLWQPNETILDDDGAILWRRWKHAVSFPITQWQNSACMIPVNPDRDNRIDVLSFTHSHEIAFRHWNGVELVSHAGWPKSFYPHLPTPPVVGDVDGDGEEEILIGTYDPAQTPSNGGLYVFALDGRLEAFVPVPGGLKHVPSIASVFGTGMDVVYRSLAGRVYIHNFGSDHAAAVSWSTHRGNASRDGNIGRSLFPLGTPLITGKQAGHRRASFSWGGSATNIAEFWRVYRANNPGGPFEHIVTLTAGARDYTDTGLDTGHQYLYEVAAVRGNETIRSAPFAMLPLYNGNLVANSGFEENSESHWDKWFTGDLNWADMTASQWAPYQGAKSMRIRFSGHGSGGSISQFGQYGTPHSCMPVAAGQLCSFGGFLKSDGLSEPSQHWLEWSSTRTGQNTDERPLRPYPDYFTPHFVPGTNATGWTYANRVFVMPAGFPNVELTHWFTTAAPASGSVSLDNLFFRVLPHLNSSEWLPLIPFRSTWRYTTEAPPPDWFASGFDDRAWLAGTAKFGAGGGPQNIVTGLPSGRPAYYFRREFSMPPGEYEELLLSATCTDAGQPLEVFLNGTRLPTTGVEAVSAQGNEVQHYDLAPFIDLLHPGGINTIAVVLQNVAQPDWDDVAFDIRLQAIGSAPIAAPLKITRTVPAPLEGVAATVVNPPAMDLTVSVPSRTVWRLESAETLDGPWQLVTLITNTSGTPSVVRDIGQNGRTHPSQAGSRYYRLVPR